MADILKYLQRHGFTARIDAGCVIVKDPIYECGPAGMLRPCGFHNVRVIDMPAAYKFVSVRS